VDVSSQGYRAPSNLQHYATYLDSRIRAYKDIKHDAVRVQAESNRDLRMSVTITDDAHQLRPGPSADMSSSAVNRSKTVAGRKLRVMTVEKGLLRETKVVQKMIDHLVECRVRSSSGSVGQKLRLAFFGTVLPRRS
jgi:hypothetical protein